MKKFRDGPNPAAWKGNLEHVFSTKRKRGHHKAIAYADMPGFMARLRSKESLSAKALEFTILTAARTGETIGMTWGEVDLPEKIWTVPEGRMKGEVEHTVPLSDRAVAILESIPKNGSDLIFPLSNMAMLQLLKGMGQTETVHGMRSAARDWALGFDRETCEFALAHKIENKTEAAYRRGTAFNKRKVLMQAWADYCSGVALADNVVKLHA